MARSLFRLLRGLYDTAKTDAELLEMSNPKRRQLYQDRLLPAALDRDALAACETLPQFRTAVVGGGFAGLMAAWYLRQCGLGVTGFEAAGRLGGRVLTDYGLSSPASASRWAARRRWRRPSTTQYSPRHPPAGRPSSFLRVAAGGLDHAARSRGEVPQRLRHRVLEAAGPRAERDLGRAGLGMGGHRPQPANQPGYDRSVYSGGPNVRPAAEYPARMARLYPGYAPTAAAFADWPNTPYIWTGYSVPSPGRVCSVGRALSAPYATRLYFAGEQTCIGYFGYMEGALQSGARAARDIVAAICPAAVGISA